MLPSADGTSIKAIQHGLVQPPSLAAMIVGQLVHAEVNAQHTLLLHQRDELQHQQQLTAAGGLRAKTPAAADGAWRRRRRQQQRQHLGQRPPPGKVQHAAGAVILDDFRSMGKRPVMVQLARRKQK